MQYLLLCLISKAQKTSRNLEEIITSTNKFAVPGTNIKSTVFTMRLAFGTMFAKICKCQIHLQITKNSSGIPTFEGNLLFG